MLYNNASPLGMGRYSNASKVYATQMAYEIADKIKANYKDGVLNIILPKTEEVKPKEIPIGIG